MMGIPVTVTVDDYLLFKLGTDNLKYAGVGPDKSLWMPILEKASGKLYGNFEMLVGGMLGHAYQMITGAPYVEYDHSDYSGDDLWTKINAGI